MKYDTMPLAFKVMSSGYNLIKYLTVYG